MKIRTRLLLFLLPTLAFSIAIISALLSYNWHEEILDGFKTRLKTAVVSTSAMINPEEPHPNLLDSSTLSLFQKELGINRVYLVSLDSFQAKSIPKDLHITPIYKSEESGTKVMTGYAPIFDTKGHIAGLVAADIEVDLIDKKFQESLFLIIASSVLTLILMVFLLFLIAHKISKPVQRLNNSALAIAAGQYGESIQVEGPKEIVELAGTLNTMSECLLENINRLKENSLQKARMYGEYECAMLLQHLMLQKNIENCRSDAIAVKPITLFSENPRGFLLDFPRQDEKFQIHLAEADLEGFEGMYQLLTQYKHSKESQAHTSILLDRNASTLQGRGPHEPIVWSLDEKRFLTLPSKIESGDFFFLFNRGFARFYKEPQKIHDLLAKVLRAFAADGLETVATMLQKELTFAAKRREIDEDLHLLSFQILNL